MFPIQDQGVRFVCSNTMNRIPAAPKNPRPDRQIKLDRIQAIAEKHGYNASQDNFDSVIVEIPYMDSTGANGVEKFEVNTYKELFDIMGY